MTERKPKIQKNEEDLLNAYEEREARKRIEKLQESNESFSKDVAFLKGVVSVMGLFVAIITIIGATNYYKYMEFVRAEKDSQEPLVFLFDDKIANTIDEMSFIDPKDSQHQKRMDELNDFKEQLNKLVIPNPKLAGRKKLVEALEFMINNKTEDTYQKLQTQLTEIIEQSDKDNDTFVASKAYTLLALNQIRQNNRKCGVGGIVNDGIVKTIQKAIEKDRRTGAAYNLLGLCQRDKALEQIKDTNKFNEAAREMRSAINYYRFAATLNPTNWTRCRAVNNSIYGSTTFLQTILKDDSLVSSYLSGTREKNNLDQFFTESLNDLEFCIELNPEHFVFLESKAQIYGLMCLYDSSRNIKQDERPALVAELKTAYLAAIDKGLFKNKNLKEALATIENDALLGEINKDPDVEIHIKQNQGSPQVKN